MGASEAIRDLLDAFDQSIESLVAGIDTRFEERLALDVLGLEPAGQAIVTRQVEIDDVVAAGPRAAALARRRLYEASRKMMGLGEQEQTDLRHVGARGDVDQILLVVGLELVIPGEVVQRGKDFFEVPRIAPLDLVQRDFGLR